MCDFDKLVARDPFTTFFQTWVGKHKKRSGSSLCLCYIQKEVGVFHGGRWRECLICVFARKVRNILPYVGYPQNIVTSFDKSPTRSRCMDKDYFVPHIVCPTRKTQKASKCVVSVLCIKYVRVSSKRPPVNAKDSDFYDKFKKMGN